ncbi:hypothetical protein ACPYO6_11840 [Georgenia sp. Z1344]|uniref:hypothetical protein n=1 Tax=Georgenia sp. Z1344 TaxID=3416706 RepID=UPI003CF18B75
MTTTTALVGPATAGFPGAFPGGVPWMFYVVPALMVLSIVVKIVQRVMAHREAQRRREHEIRMLELRRRQPTAPEVTAVHGPTDDAGSPSGFGAGLSLEEQYLRSRAKGEQR